jgi:hypothetical protein
MSIDAARRQPALSTFAPALFAAVSIVLALRAGKDLNWDLLNYHFYNAWAFVDGRDDVAPAQAQSYFNPLLDLPLYYAIRNLAPWLVAVLYATVQSINAELIRRLALHVLPAHWPRHLLAVCLGLMVLAGAIFRGEVGGAMGDTLVSLPLLAGVLHLVRAETPRPRTALIAGLCAGCAAGLKLTMLLYALGFGLATVVLDSRPLLQRWRYPLWFGIGALVGFLALDGWWMLRIEHAFSNPLFPFYNDIFHSPLAPPELHNDTRFRPHGFVEALLYPIAWTLHPQRVTDTGRFFDLRLPLLFALSLIRAGRSLGRGSPKPLDRRALYILVGCATSYVLWLGAFGYFRYAAVLEMLAPLLIAVLVLPGLVPTRRTGAVLVVLTVLLVLPVIPLREARGDWSAPYFGIVLPPEVAHADPNALVLVGGTAPLAFVLPQLAPSQRFVRVQSNFMGQDSVTGLDAHARDIVARHHGALFALVAGNEMVDMDPVLARYGLRRGDVRDCASISSAAQRSAPPLLESPSLWCELQRR